MTDARNSPPTRRMKDRPKMYHQQHTRAVPAEIIDFPLTQARYQSRKRHLIKMQTTRVHNQMEWSVKLHSQRQQRTTHYTATSSLFHSQTKRKRLLETE